MLKKILLPAILLLALVLRFYHLDSNPPSPYWEEAAIGYDAYSILKTGRDFHGHKLPFIAFESFGDYKPSLYFYAAVPSVALFGLNTLAVRFPSAFFGVLTVLLIYYLTQSLFPKKKPLALLAAFFLAVSPWHLQLSRAGFEANLGLFLIILGAWLFFKGLKQKLWWLPASVSWGLSLYAYHANRVFIPLLVLSLGLLYFKKLWLKKWPTFAALAIFLTLFLPLAVSLNSPKIKQRFQQTSAFATLDPIIKSNQLIEADGGGVIPRFIHHRFWQYADIFLDHYLDHFNFDFLFLSGDINPRHSTQLVGGLYLIQLPLLLLGLAYLFTNQRKTFWLLLTWLLLAPIPAGLTKATPHALRSLPMLIPLAIISAAGLSQLIAKNKKVLTILFSLLLVFEFVRYLSVYHFNYPRLYSDHWQYGYQEMVNFVADRQDQYDHIYITRQLGRPSIYYWFYTQTDPRQVQAVNCQVKKDQGEYLEFQNLSFFLPSDQTLPANSLIVSTPDKEIENATLMKPIKDLNNQVVFNLYWLATPPALD